MSSLPSSIAALPGWEICIYWLLSMGSHLYSFYHLHRFSKEYEGGLDREFELEEGLLIPGFKKDPTDFEWSFWNERARKCLIWSFLGHAVVSKLCGFCFPQGRLAVLTVYGLLAAWAELGTKGVGVLFLHTCLFFGVAHLRSPALTWACALMLLATLYLGALEELQRSWYDTEAEYYLLYCAIAVCCLRSISFSLEHAWCPLEAGGLERFFWLTSYTFYHPLFYNGPIITFRDYMQQMQRSGGTMSRQDVPSLLASAVRICTCWALAELLIHLMYMHALAGHETYLQFLPPWALGGLALALVQFFFVKYLVLFGLPSLLSRLDGLRAPRLPRCVSIMYSFTGMWRHFDVGLYHWLVRYIYIPAGGSHRGPLRKILSTALAFAFVCYWHGGHDYLRNWALINWLGVLVENGVKSALRSPRVSPLLVSHLSPAMRRRCLAFLSSFSTAMLILSNMVFLGGNHLGRIFWKRVFVQGWPTITPPILVFLYCFAQIGLEQDRKEQQSLLQRPGQADDSMTHGCQ